MNIAVGATFGSCSAGALFQDLSAAQARYAMDPVPPTMQKNVLIAPFCSTADSNAGLCITPANCTNAATCLATVLANGAYLGNLTTTGFPLLPAAPCRVAQGGVTLAAYTKDPFGIALTAPVSIGAQESDATCT